MNILKPPPPSRWPFARSFSFIGWPQDILNIYLEHTHVYTHLDDNRCEEEELQHREENINVRAAYISRLRGDFVRVRSALLEWSVIQRVNPLIQVLPSSLVSWYCTAVEVVRWYSCADGRYAPDGTLLRKLRMAFSVAVVITTHGCTSGRFGWKSKPSLSIPRVGPAGCGVARTQDYLINEVLHTTIWEQVTVYYPKDCTGHVTW
jgi:hypothetical protein